MEKRKSLIQKRYYFNFNKDKEYKKEVINNDGKEIIAVFVQIGDDFIEYINNNYFI